jgi:pyruvate,water dikinase
MEKSQKHILWFEEIRMDDVALVGGKNASLGEMISQLSKVGVNVPNGFATTSAAFRYFMDKSGLKEKIGEILKDLDVKNIKNLQERGKKARDLILKSQIPADLEKEILKSYRKLSKKYGQEESDVAVRTSATAEDLPGASFAGQYWTYLNIKSGKELLKAVKGCLASLFTDRAIFYRVQHNFSHLDLALSVGVQKMVRSDLGASGVMFSLDTESGFRNVVLIDGSYGLGEMIVQGEVTPDEFYVFKPTLKKGYKAIISKTLGSKEQKFVYDKKGGIKRVKVSQKEREKFCLKDEEILTLAEWACLIEEHYSKRAGKWTPMDMEWAKDGRSGELFIVQARPETVHAQDKGKYYQEYKIKVAARPILTGIAVGSKIAQGKVHKILDTSKLKEFKKGEILVTRMTDPDWVPAMKMAKAIVTDEGGKTCHAAIISRELGISCVVGTGQATQVLENEKEVTVDCSRGLEGRIFKGKVPFTVKKYDLGKIPKLKTEIMVNLGAPEAAFKTSFLPVDGVGLAREEFIIAEKIRIHPLALYHFDRLKDKKLKKKIAEITIEHKKDKKEFFIKELAEGIGQIAAAFYPKPVIVRFSDFKTNEYKQLIGGELFEPEEENPMLGWRGASRYYHKEFQPAFEMEIEAIKRARNIFGLKNIWTMIPFCRTIEEGRKVLEIMKKKGLEKGSDGLKVIVMCEIPSNVILIDKFLDIFDGMSIGSNDLTQLTLGLDRDNGEIAYVGNENNEAVKEQVRKVIKICRRRRKYVGICGQAPSDYPEFARFIMKEGIETMSLNSDTVIKTILNLSKNQH